MTTQAIEKTIAVTVQVPESHLEDAIAAGMISGPHGYAYWCSQVKVRNQPDLSSIQIARHVLAGGSARVYEIAEDSDSKDERHTLTSAKLLKGYGIYLAGHRSHNEIDAPASDLIMQYAIFGEQKYG